VKAVAAVAFCSPCISRWYGDRTLRAGARDMLRKTATRGARTRPSVKAVAFCVSTSACALVSCGYFTPQTGALQATRCGPVATGSYGAYGQPIGNADCVDGEDAGVNSVVPDGGATGNILIADQFNNRVIEITRQGEIVWSFGDGSSVPGPTSIVAPNDVERLPNGQTLMAGTGAPPGTEPDCPADGGGCPDNRVLIVDDATNTIVWQYGADGGVSGAGQGQLFAPVAAVLVPTAAGDHVLITDQGNARIIEVVRATNEISWQFPPPNATSDQSLAGPNSAERLANGNTLIADETGNRVLEVATDGTIVWQYPVAVDTSVLDAPAFASRLPSGNTLIADSNNNRVLEVDSASPPNVVWTYETAPRATQGMTTPTSAVRLANGHTLVTEPFVDQVIEIDGTPQQNVVFVHGGLDVAGKGMNELNQAYDARVVGDFTGLTAPSM
jgi:outer membrane protein assembly factor BamB